jgi:glycerophosphoryl diester phosphodiesterase
MQPLWISHRGFHAEAAENSAAAFAAALAMGFPAVETDLRATRDGHVVLCHDPTLERLCGDPRLVSAASRAELAKVRARDGSPLYFLDEFLGDCRDARWTFDVKRETAPESLRLLRELVDRGAAGVAVHEFARRASFVSWSWRHEVLCRALFPGASFYARERQCWRAGLAVIGHAALLGGITRGRTYALPPRLGSRPLYRPELVRAYQRRGARVLAYLPETEADTRAALAAGVDEVLTNGRPLIG